MRILLRHPSTVQYGERDELRRPRLNLLTAQAEPSEMVSVLLFLLWGDMTRAL